MKKLKLISTFESFSAKKKIYESKMQEDLDVLVGLINNEANMYCMDDTKDKRVFTDWLKNKIESNDDLDMLRPKLKKVLDVIKENTSWCTDNKDDLKALCDAIKSVCESNLVEEIDSVDESSIINECEKEWNALSKDKKVEILKNAGHSISANLLSQTETGKSDWKDIPEKDKKSIYAEMEKEGLIKINESISDQDQMIIDHFKGMDIKITPKFDLKKCAIKAGVDVEDCVIYLTNLEDEKVAEMVAKGDYELFDVEDESLFNESISSMFESLTVVNEDVNFEDVELGDKLEIEHPDGGKLHVIAKEVTKSRIFWYDPTSKRMGAISPNKVSKIKRIGRQPGTKNLVLDTVRVVEYLNKSDIALPLLDAITNKLTESYPKTISKSNLIKELKGIKEEVVASIIAGLKDTKEDDVQINVSENKRFKGLKKLASINEAKLIESDITKIKEMLPEVEFTQTDEEIGFDFDGTPYFLTKKENGNYDAYCIKENGEKELFTSGTLEEVIAYIKE